MPDIPAAELRAAAEEIVAAEEDLANRTWRPGRLAGSHPMKWTPRCGAAT